MRKGVREEGLVVSVAEVGEGEVEVLLEEGKTARESILCFGSRRGRGIVGAGKGGGVGKPLPGG